jgi:hypothetical protein
MLTPKQAGICSLVHANLREVDTTEIRKSLLSQRLAVIWTQTACYLMLYLMRSAIFLYGFSRIKHLNAFPGDIVQHHCKGPSAHFGK